MARSLNRVQLIGNLTKDPELRYTPQGTAVASFTVATNRQWKTESGDNRDEAEFHRIVAWDKLAEICSQLLGKGKKVFVEGRIQTRKWTGQDGQTRYTTEIVITDMLLLDRAKDGGDYSSPDDSMEIPDNFDEMDFDKEPEPSTKPSPKKSTKKTNKVEPAQEESEDEDIPF